jgi:hypothetical protein
MDQRPSLLDTFLERLENQLFKSVYLNGFPTVPESLDLCTIDQNERQLAEKWIQQILLNDQLLVDVSANTTVVQDLRHLYFEGKSREINFGEKDLAFGYPFLLLKNEENPFTPKMVPLFIWSLQMEASPNRTDNWHFKYEKGQEFRLNPFLGSYLNEVFDEESLKELQTACKEYRKTTSFQPLIELLEKIGTEKGLEFERPEGDIIPFPNNNQINILAEKGTILWAGLLGLFPRLSPKLLDFLSEPQEEEERAKDNSPAEDDEDSVKLSSAAPIHPFGIFPPDNYQVGINRVAYQSEVTYVDGKPGSGKTQSLTNLITNALSNGKKCLVVSERVHVLKDIQSRLIEKKLGGLTFLLQDLYNDKPLFLEHTRRAIENLKNNPGFSAESFELALGKCLRSWQKMDQAFQAANGNIFGNFSWTETVGKFLRSNKEEGKELLSSQLNPGDFVFTFSEYEMLREAIEISRPLFEQINTLKHPLTDLHPDVFLYKNSKESREWIEKKLKTFLKKTTELQYRYIRKLDAYTQKLTEHYEQHYRELKQTLVGIREHIEDFRNRFGAEFEDAGVVTSSKLHFYGVFSHKHKEILQAKEDISEQYQNLQKIFLERQYFDYRFPGGSDTRHLKRIRQSLQDFEKTLEHWYQKLPASIQEEVHRLNSKTVHVDLDYFEQIRELEYALDVLVEELNSSNLFLAPFASNRLTITKRQQYIETIMEKLEFIQYNLRDFTPFYDWQKNWLSLGDISQKLIRALVKVKPDNWQAAFESWYFHNRLTLDYHSELPHEDVLLDEFINCFHLLRDQLPSQILDFWHKKLTLTSRALKRKARSTYAVLFGKNNLKSLEDISLEELFQQNHSTLSDAVPVLLSTPSAALELFLPMNTEKATDFLIIDEADSLDLSLIYPLLKTAEHTVAFGKKTPLGRPHEESLMDYAMQISGKKIDLKNQHLSVPADLHYFLRAIFDDTVSKLPSPASLSGSSSFRVHPLEGRYDEVSGNNDVEARKIVDLLNTVPKTPQQTFPRVIIACMTHEQRDLILDYLLKIKQRRSNGSDRVRQLERNGLAVLCVDELQGHRADILIISGSYGSINLKQEISGDIFWLNTPEGLQSLHHLFSCSSGQTWICHSIPKNRIKTLADDWENQGTALFSHFLLYAEASQNGNHEECIHFLDRIFEERQLPSENTRTSVFVQELAEALKPYFEEGRIQLDQYVDDLPLPLVLSQAFEEEPNVILLADGFLYKDSLGAYFWEDATRKRLKEMGYQIHSTWSSQWWKNPAQEARKIASLIIKLDNEYRKVEAPPEESEEHPLSAEEKNK